VNIECGKCKHVAILSGFSSRETCPNCGSNYGVVGCGAFSAPGKALSVFGNAGGGGAGSYSNDAELSALREELATTKGELDSLLARYSNMWDAHDKCAERLTAAEQRNVTLIQLLSEVTPYEPYLGSKLFKRISAAIKPVDPVQAVCTSCDGSGEYTDAIGDWRGYCSCPDGVALKNKPTESGASE
jgi:hypothetical protein